jgi:hypothetical protein
MGKLRAVAIGVLGLIALVSIFGKSIPSMAGETRFGAQLALTDLWPRQIAISPDDEKLLLVVNAHGRIEATISIQRL